MPIGGPEPKPEPVTVIVGSAGVPEKLTPEMLGGGVGRRTRSRHGDITTGKQAKHGFDDIETLHALITDPADPGFAGTEFT